MAPGTIFQTFIERVAIIIIWIIIIMLVSFLQWKSSSELFSKFKALVEIFTSTNITATNTCLEKLSRWRIIFFTPLYPKHLLHDFKKIQNTFLSIVNFAQLSQQHPSFPHNYLISLLFSIISIGGTDKFLPGPIKTYFLLLSVVWRTQP